MRAQDHGLTQQAQSLEGYELIWMLFTTPTLAQITLMHQHNQPNHNPAQRISPLNKSTKCLENQKNQSHHKINSHSREPKATYHYANNYQILRDLRANLNKAPPQTQGNWRGLESLEHERRALGIIGEHN